MISNYFKVFLILFLFIFSNEAKSKNNQNIEFSVNELSNYFSAVVSYGNQNNEEALKYFKSSRNLLNKHEEYLRQYIFSLVLNQNVNRAIQEIKFSENKKNSIFFESYLLLFLDSIKKKDYEKSNFYLNQISNYKDQGRFEQVIYETLRNYLFTFEKKKISPKKNCVIGFGITEKSIGKLKSADGLVVGSAICKEITKSIAKRQNPVTNVSKIVIKLKNRIS